MKIKDIEDYPRKMAIEGNPSELYALLNSAINGLTKVIETFGEDTYLEKAKKEVEDRRKDYFILFEQLNKKIKFHDS